MGFFHLELKFWGMNTVVSTPYCKPEACINVKSEFNKHKNQWADDTMADMNEMCEDEKQRSEW